VNASQPVREILQQSNPNQWLILNWQTSAKQSPTELTLWELAEAETSLRKVQRFYCLLPKRNWPERKYLYQAEEMESRMNAGRRGTGCANKMKRAKLHRLKIRRHNNRTTRIDTNPWIMIIIDISIYTLSHLGVLSNLIGSISLANEHYSPPTEWIMRKPNKNKMAGENSRFASVSNRFLMVSFWKCCRDHWVCIY